MKATTACMTFICALGIATSVAMPSRAADETELLGIIRGLRIKQQNEENVVRLQAFINTNKEEVCSPVQQARQRMDDINAQSGETTEEEVTINAGHEELNVTDNHGTINSDINVNIIKNGGERGCL